MTITGLQNFVSKTLGPSAQSRRKVRWHRLRTSVQLSPVYDCIQSGSTPGVAAIGVRLA